jgi:hypothetical protein
MDTITPMKTGIQIIALERERQLNEEKFDAKRDDAYVHNELAMAATCYARPYNELLPGSRIGNWPDTWSEQWWKPSPDDRVRELSKAGALIAAEIDRLNRLEARAGGKSIQHPSTQIL